ncbi:hypothetical protein C1166_16965 [Enterobacter bugandensis]|uniref:Uncharacterized protein n=1 Tax=Enterobacter bugandensis TaxID=881260 RepID=A0ABX4VQC4_9ENTR|nr:hypothetical protein C1166_16965 [Enterobacter bugandensis]PNF56930.1 hypothetical protein C1169_21420 [Enterobacter bugandensis]PNF65720.1 hypothetical protein C1168_21420 [Enterobacter bugandensis]PNF70359.1 hypothetical protein C1167_21420 [Enterobacter bugandensis]QCE23530.1 hypothetical protein FAI36_12145 [Enterobacter bugandensis]
MTLTNRAKTILRWGGISLVFAIYSIALMIPVLDFGLTRKYNAPPLTDEMEARLCEAIIDDLSRSVDNLLITAFYGSAICLVLVLLIFKKVR